MTKKAVLISILPKWCEMIANGEKTVEVRKTRPKLKPPFKCYIYCTNKKPFLVWGDVFRGNWDTEFTHLYGYSCKKAEEIWDVFNGRIMGEFTCADILPIGRRGFDHNFDYCYLSLRDFGNDDIEPYIRAVRESRLSKSDLHNYAKDNPFLYAWQISDLEVYDTPKELSEFSRLRQTKFGLEPVSLKRPPQSWCYVEDLDDEIANKEST